VTVRDKSGAEDTYQDGSVPGDADLSAPDTDEETTEQTSDAEK
jgi:hypothetical protein